jgi:murein DD-endopeptidase MepM/ murein hydrolase activator NlpD
VRAGRWLVVAVSAAAILRPAGAPAPAFQAVSAPTRAGEPSGALVAAPAYYRPVLFGARAFPVVRSNFLSLIEIESDWHAPRLRLIDGKWQLVGVHEGIDIMGERGTPIVSMTSGVVENAGWLFYSGLRVGVRGDDGRYYFYAHLSSLAGGVVVGARVGAGSYLGRLGSTGYGDPGERDQFPPHLHFGIQAGADWIDPYGTLVSLYEATVSADDEGRSRLDALAAAGKTGSWHQMADDLFLGLPVSDGE